VYLRVEIFTVGNDEESEVAMQLATYLSHEHHHRITLARTLRMPEHTELTIQLLSILYAFHQIVDTEILVVLCDDFDSFIIEEDEILDIVQEAFLAEETVYQIGDAQSMAFYLNTVWFLFLIIHTKPFEEKFILAVPCTYLGLQAIAQHADLVHRKDVRDVLAIARQVLVVGFLYLDSRIFEFDEDHRQTVDEEQYIGTAIAIMSLDPHLVDAMKVVPFGMVEVDESHDGKVFLAEQAF